MKPFDIEKAKAGHPVCTRDGRKARIICFDVKGDGYPIIALIDEGESEYTRYYNKKGKTEDYPDGYDLMMASEKKTGWINIYPLKYEGRISIIYSCVYKTQKDAKENASSGCIATVPIEWEE